MEMRTITRRSRGRAVFTTIATCVVAFLTGAPSCKRQGEPQNAVPEGSPELFVVDGPLGENLGLVGIGIKARRTVLLRNISDHQLEIQVVRESCGCIEATIEPSMLSPQEEARITFGTVVLGGEGDQTHAIEIEAVAQQPSGSQSLRQRTALLLSYTPDVEFFVYPTAITVRTTVAQTFHRQLYVRANALRNLVVTKPSCSIDGVVVAEPQTSKKGTAVILEVTGRLDVAGTFDGYVEFHTDSQRFDTVRVPLWIEVRPPWMAVPAGVAVNLTGVTSIVESRLTVSRLPPLSVAPRRLTVRLDRAVEGVTLARGENASDDTDPLAIDISIDPRTIASDSGHQFIELFDSNGELALRIPLVWYREQSNPR